jgi:hypothetical protein
VIVGQVEQDECRQLGPFLLLPRAYESIKLIEEFVGPELVRIIRIEIGKLRVKVIA